MCVTKPSSSLGSSEQVSRPINTNYFYITILCIVIQMSAIWILNSCFLSHWAIHLSVVSSQSHQSLIFTKIWQFACCCQWFIIYSGFTCWYSGLSALLSGAHNYFTVELTFCLDSVVEMLRHLYGQISRCSSSC